jgi:uncharacterized protein (TIGR02099 family)
MLKTFPVHFLRHSLNWLMRLTKIVSAVAAVLFALAIIVLRYWLLPDIEQYHDRITSSLSDAIGNPLTIGKIQGDWQGLLPHLNFTDVRILDEQRQPALVLQRIDGNVSWMSLFTAELRLASLEIVRPELLIRRDKQGNIFVGSVALSKQGDANDLANWLLHQSNMVVRNGLIVWVDEQRDAPPLVLQQVNLRIDSLFSKHSFALRATPPSELATPLDVRGELRGENFDNLGTWHGQIFTQLDYTDVTAWRPWLDLPGKFSRGRGALRGWLGVKDGRVAQITADLDLRDVATKLAEDVPELVLLELRGRASWQDVTGGFEISTKRLATRLQNGVEFQPTDFYFRTVNASNEQPAGGQLRANLLQLESLASLTKFLPMEADLRAHLEAYAPRGKVSSLDAQWQGVPGKPDSYKLKGHFENLAINQVGKTPGFSGLTVDVNGNETSGRLNINSRRLAVDAPGVMREPLFFATLTSQVGWRQDGGELSINVDNVAVANDDLAGNLHGDYHTLAGTLGVLDLTVSLTRGDIRRAARYTPLIALNREGNDWLNGALLAGHTEDFRLRIKGNLSDFPLDGTKRTLFEIGGHARDAVMEFDKHWPRIENINCELLIRGNRLEVKSPSATLLHASLQNVTVTLPNMLSKDLSLEIKGEAVAASNSFLEFIQKSPVRGYIDGFTDGISANGSGQLDLFTRIPLLGDKRVEVSGRIKVQDNDIDLGEGVPLLRKTRGTLSFTEKGMQASGVSAEILGGTASINMQSAEGGVVHATLKGRSNVDVWRITEPHPLLSYLHGSTDWDADIRVEKKSAKIAINSNLQGVSSSLPQPFSKRTDEMMTLHLEKNPVLILPKRPVPGKACPEPCPKVEGSVAEGQDVIAVQLGNLLSARLARREEGGAMVIKRGTVNFGIQDKSLEAKRVQESSRSRDGVWLAGSLPVLSIQGWEGLARDARKAGSAVPIAGANLRIEKLTGYRQSISALHIEAIKRGDGLAVQLSGSGLNGEVVWEPHGYETGSMFRAHLSNLQWLNDERPEQPEQPLWSAEPVNSALPGKAENADKTLSRNGGAEGTAGQLLPQAADVASVKGSLRSSGEPAGLPLAESNVSQMHPNDLPALEIAIENLQLKGKQIGHFELVGHPDGKDWRLRRLNITNPDGSLVGDGIWSDTTGKMQTQVNLVLDISDAGKILGRSGYPNTVKGGSGRLAANLSWAGTPDEFSYATLNGTLKLDTGKGRFLKMDTGAGKLLSVLSLQDLPKHVALGFTDVFSEGFQFDNIIGEATIKNGVMDTQELHIYGSAAKVALKGSVDLNRETQNLSVKVYPAVGDSVSLLAVFAINPAAGIAGLIADKLLGNPLDKLVSFEYNVSGTWSDPSVVKVGGAPAKAKENNPSE